jgi:hygromycin-B 7''-O-kinase
MAALHRVPAPAIENWWPGDWAAFAARQRTNCVAAQAELGLAPAWADQIEGFLDSVTIETGPPVLLHTEIMRQHLLVSQDGRGSWQLSGLFDFEPAMRGAREYEFAAVGVFVSHGDSRFLRRVLTAYGYTAGQLGPDLSRRLFAWTLLHRYSNLPGYLSRLPPPRQPTLGALAERWFGTA